MRHPASDTFVAALSRRDDGTLSLRVALDVLSRAGARELPDNLLDMGDVRGYAASRAKVARKALAGAKGGGGAGPWEAQQ